MKLIKKIGLMVCMSAIIITDAFSQDSDGTATREPYIKPSQHLAIPDTESILVTKPQSMRPELTAVELTRLMGNGVNLGNTMEAYRTSSMGTTEEPTLYEQLWGQPVTTAAQMKAYKKAGFDSIRIPVAWTNAMAYEKGDYTINSAYLNRVETIVNYALDADLYVIFNDHWDGGWWGMFGSANPQTRKDAMELYVDMWTQLATRFKNYSDYVIFEGGNEEIGSRLNDVNVCYDSGTLSENDCYTTANLISQTFVDTVRGTGGNNGQRFLLIPGYNTDIDKTCDSRFVMPNDTVKNKLLISVHYYNPWAFCGDGASAEHWGTVKEIEEQNKALAKMISFTKSGYGVVIGEFQAEIDKNNKINPDSIGFFNNFLSNCDLYGYSPMLWETNGWFDRNAGKLRDKDVAQLFSSRNYEKEKDYSQSEITEKAQKCIRDYIAAAPESFSDNKFVGKADKAISWIMYNSGDYANTYSVGDAYNPDSKSKNVTPADVEITGEGTYTVSLTFTSASYSTAFCALAIANGELLFPGWCIDIKEIAIDGKMTMLTGKPYTSSDDGKCTRVNLYNGWVTSIPSSARTIDGDKTGINAVIINRDDWKKITKLSITFYYGPQKTANTKK
jgi:endoglucanase